MAGDRCRAWGTEHVGGLLQQERGGPRAKGPWEGSTAGHHFKCSSGNTVWGCSRSRDGTSGG